MERPTVDLATDRSRTVRLSKPGVVDKPQRAGARSNLEEIAKAIDKPQRAGARSNLEEIAKAIDKPRNNGGAYSVVATKKPAGTVARVGVGSPPGCDLLDVSDGHVLVRIHGSVVKLSEADARGLIELLTKALP